MKVYSICFIDPNGKDVRFTTPKTRFHFNYDNTVIYETTADITEAKHYETMSAVKGSIRNYHKRIAREFEDQKKQTLPTKIKITSTTG